jgi:hypothetical protein
MAQMAQIQQGQQQLAQLVQQLQSQQLQVLHLLHEAKASMGPGPVQVQVPLQGHPAQLLPQGQLPQLQVQPLQWSSCQGRPCGPLAGACARPALLLSLLAGEKEGKQDFQPGDSFSCALLLADPDLGSAQSPVPPQSDPPLQIQPWVL